jgi:hypothetical protein
VTDQTAEGIGSGGDAKKDQEEEKGDGGEKLAVVK